MIEFSDITLNESVGNFLHTKELMEKEGPSKWMLATEASVVTPAIASSFTLHLWDTGEVYIMATTHPITMEAPNDDLRFLKEWCDVNGWKIPTIHKDYLESPKEFEFWLRMFYIGLIRSDILAKHEQGEMKRMNEAYQREQLEDEDEELRDAY